MSFSLTNNKIKRFTKSYTLKIAILAVLLFVMGFTYNKTYDLTAPSVKVLSVSHNSKMVAVTLSLSSTLPLKYLKVRYSNDNIKSDAFITFKQNNNKVIVNLYYPYSSGTKEIILDITLKDARKIKKAKRKIAIK